MIVIVILILILIVIMIMILIFIVIVIVIVILIVIVIVIVLILPLQGCQAGGVAAGQWRQKYGTVIPVIRCGVHDLQSVCLMP